ncbi:hypothetical protein EB241_14235 [Erwinia psidii]|uniref:Uncharacterized protein n=1 Tax=Erwinia psidii TaxID=69224 RepID=A0A3N6RX60_9GAMM|nr:hypothetical protein EB241_14235 [Erwinia psidii]
MTASDAGCFRCCNVRDVAGIISAMDPPGLMKDCRVYRYRRRLQTACHQCRIKTGQWNGALKKHDNCGWQWLPGVMPGNFTVAV